MVSPSLRSLAASAYLIASIALSTAAPIRSIDACGILGGTDAESITYDLVAACYKAIPFDEKIRLKTLEPILEVFDKYYVFRDSALTPDLKVPFTSAPVDIVKELTAIKSKKYKNDFELHTSIAQTIDSLHDAHASYYVDCYSAYSFYQPLILYAPVINGRQSARVLQGKSDHPKLDYFNYEVKTIEGIPALSYLQNFADSLSISKDAGVRLNAAFGKQNYFADSSSFDIVHGGFAGRTTLPEKSTVTYELQGPNSASTITTTLSWIVEKKTKGTFENVHSYLENVCKKSKKSPSKDGTPSKRELSSPAKKGGPCDFGSVITLPKPTSHLPKAKLLGSGITTAFYQLQDPSSVGIAVVHTLDFPDGSPAGTKKKELECIAHYLSEFNRLKVSKIILDFQNNSGGFVDFASTIVQLFFPNTHPFDKILPQDMRVDESIKTLSGKVIGKDKLYDASGFVDFATGKKYESNELFLHPIPITRNGRRAMYTDRTGIYTHDLQNDPKFKEIDLFPWTNKAKNIRILSDGLCGSSCALSSYYLHTLYKVPTYSVGGIHGKELSVFSFAGGSVTDLDSLISDYNFGKVPTTLKPLPYNGELRFPYLEVYAKDRSVPLEYDYSQYAANTHLNFDPDNARNRDILWTQVANDAWKSSKSKPHA